MQNQRVERGPLRLLEILITSVLSWFLYLCFILIFANGNDLSSRFLSLNHWDSGWYGTIVDWGYVSTIPPTHQNGAVSNVAFFPGYPILARFLYLYFKVPLGYSLLIVSNLACIAFLANFTIIIRSFFSQRLYTLVAIALVLLFPTSFYLVSGYSESLFLAGLTGFIVGWQSLSAQKNINMIIYGCICGFLMTSTRIVGLPIAFIPLIHVSLKGLFDISKSKVKFEDIKRTSYYSIASALGGLLFFGYCQLAWGHWNLYSWTQKIGWGVRPDYLFFINNFQLKGLLYFFTDYSLFDPHNIDSNRFSFALTGLFAIIVAVGSVFIARRIYTQRKVDVWVFLWGVIASQFIIASAGLADHHYKSMSRYLLPSFVFIVPLLLTWFKKIKQSRTSRILIFVITGLFVFAAVNAQVEFIKRVTSGQWVSYLH